MFDIRSLFENALRTLKEPRAFFSSFEYSGGLKHAVVLAVFYGLINGLISFFYAFSPTTPIPDEVPRIAVGTFSFIAGPISALILLIILALVMKLMAVIGKGEAKFGMVIQVAAPVLVMVPVSSLFSLVTQMNLMLGFLISLGLSAYGIWLIYNALVYALKSNEMTIRVISFLFFLLMSFLNFLSLPYIQQSQNGENRNGMGGIEQEIDEFENQSQDLSEESPSY